MHHTSARTTTTRSRTTRTGAALAALGTGVVLTLTATPAHGAEAVVACGTTVTTDAYLAADLDCGDGPGITVTGDATLDLAGHTLSGSGRTTGSFGVHLLGEGHQRVRNGHVRDFFTGISASATGTKTVDGVHVTDSANGVAHGGDLFESATADVRVTGSVFTGNTTGIAAQFFDRITVTSSDLSDNNWGVDVSTGTLALERSRLSSNAAGVLCSTATCTIVSTVLRDHATDAVFQFEGDVTIERSRLDRNGSGYSANFGTGRVVRSDFDGNVVAVMSGFEQGTEVTRSSFRRNGTGYTTQGTDDVLDTLTGNTLRRNGDAIRTDSPAVALGSNTAVANDGWGIHAPGATDLGGNRAKANGNDPQCVGVTC